MLFLPRLKRPLASPRIAGIVAAIAIVLTLPAAWTGLALDDHFHAMRARGADPTASPFDLFNFASGEPGCLTHLIDQGVLPWFSSSGLKLAFWRPVSSFMHWVDYNYLGAWPWLMHLESLCWYAVLVALAAKLYRRLITTPWVAGLAALLYAVDDAHGLPVGWIANRNAVTAAAFGMAALVSHDRWRRDGWRAGIVVGPCFLALGLLSAEAALATTAYLAAYVLFVDRAALARRIASLAPYGVVLALWQIGYRSLGYGASGSAFYLDPVREPRLYSASLAKRGVALLVAQFLTPPSDLWAWLSPGSTIIVMVFALAILAWVGWVLAPLIARDRTARFFLTGLVLAVLPVCATFPSDRLLIFIGFGAMGLVAQVLGALTDGATWMPRARRYVVPARVLGGVWLVGHLVLSAMFLPVSAYAPRVPEAMVEAATAQLTLGPDLRTKDLIVVNTPDLLRAMYGFVIPRGANSQPRHARFLSVTFGSAVVERTDAQTLTVKPREGYLHDMSSGLVHSEAFPMHRGQRVEMSGMTAEVIEMNAEGRPAAVSFRFTRPLEDPQLRFVSWDGKRYVDFVPPVAGASVVVGVDGFAL